MTRHRVSSASGTKAGTTLRTLLTLSALSFRFCPKGKADHLWGLDSAENARFGAQPSFRVQAASCKCKRINAGGFCVACKTAGHSSSPSSAKVSSLRWLAYELMKSLNATRLIARTTSPASRLTAAKISLADADGIDRGRQHAQPQSKSFQGLLNSIPYIFCLFPVTHSQLFVL